MPPGRPPLLQGLEDEIVGRYRDGETIAALCEAYNVSDAPIIRILDAAGVERRRGRPPGSSPSPRPPRDPGKRPPNKPKVSVPPSGLARVRDEVLRRDGYRCRMCGSRERLTVEYAIPASRGGDPHKPETLRTVCAPCASSPTEGRRGILGRLFGR